MFIFKSIILLIIVLISTYIGFFYSKNYSNRVKELEEIKNALSMFVSKIKYTLLPVSEVFFDIGKNLDNNIGKFFINVSKNIDNDNISDMWSKEIKILEKQTNLNKDDMKILLNLSTMIGNADIDGQISNINLIIELMEKQIQNARNEEIKNSKLYKTLGAGAGLTIVIILI